MTRPCVFVAPDPTGPISGGNLYNLHLVAALRRRGVAVAVVDRARAGSAADPGASAADGFRIIDSLYLADVPRLAPAWLLLHYLPSLVEGRDSLSPPERAAIRSAKGIVVPSPFMADAVARMAPDAPPIAVVAPGLDVALRPITPTSRAILVANVVPGKGIQEFLRALGPRRLPLSILGALDRDPPYADACRRAAARLDVDLLGPRPHAEALALVAASAFLVSPSRMESFGLALAEARALGTPILALDRGNARAHVDDASGGALFATDEALADACVALAADEEERVRRRRAALAHRPAPRSWDDAAADFAALL